MDKISRWFAFRSLQARIMTWFMLLSLLPVLLIVWLGLGHAQARMESEIISDTEQTALSLAQAIDSNIEDILVTARILTQANDIRQAFSDFDNAFKSDALYSMAYQQAEDKHWPYLSFFSEKQKIRDMLFVNRDGFIVFSSAQSDLYGQSLSALNDEFPQLEALANDTYARMDMRFTLGPSADNPAFAAIPVKYDEKTGIIIWLPEASHFLNMFSRNIGADRIVSIFTHTNDQIRPWPDTQSDIDSAELIQLITRAYSGDIIREHLYIDNKDWLISIRPLPAVNGVIMVQRLKETALLPIRQLRWTVMMGTGILAIILILLARKVSNGVTQPLKQLANQFDRIRMGERKVHIDEQRQDELGMLAHQFNQMAKSLRTTQSQLVQSEKMASIGHLAAGIAHEINNPMSIVTANFNMLQEYLNIYNSLADLLNQYMKALQQGSEEAIDSCLQAIRALSEEQNLEYIVSDVNDIVNESSPGLERVKIIIESLQVFSDLGRHKPVEVEFSLFVDHVLSSLNVPAEPAIRIHKDIKTAKPVHIREAEMRKAFISVLDNAVKACHNGGDIRIMARQKNAVTLIEIRDSGEGMDEQHLARIFDPFYTTRPVGNGLGLGLSITHTIITAHGGNIWITSRPGEGTRVRISLPNVC